VGDQARGTEGAEERDAEGADGGGEWGEDTRPQLTRELGERHELPEGYGAF